MEKGEVFIKVKVTLFIIILALSFVSLMENHVVMAKKDSNKSENDSHKSKKDSQKSKSEQNAVLANLDPFGSQSNIAADGVTALAAPVSEGQHYRLCGMSNGPFTGAHTLSLKFESPLGCSILNPLTIQLHNCGIAQFRPPNSPDLDNWTCNNNNNFDVVLRCVSPDTVLNGFTLHSRCTVFSVKETPPPPPTCPPGQHLEGNVCVPDTPPPIDHPPVADSQSLSTPENTPLSITLTATDQDNQAFTFQIVDQPQHGTLDPALNTDNGAVGYKPANGFTGSDSFTFKVKGTGGELGSNLESNIATINIDVKPAAVNNPPVAFSETIPVKKNSQAQFQLRAEDPDGPPPLTFQIRSQPTNGELTLGQNFETTGLVTYKPRTNFIGTDSFTFTASDGENDEDFSILAVSDPATITLSVGQGGSGGNGTGSGGGGGGGGGGGSVGDISAIGINGDVFGSGGGGSAAANASNTNILAIESSSDTNNENNNNNVLNIANGQSSSNTD